MQDNEIWKDISGWPSYQVSESGRVRTTGRKIKTSRRVCTIKPRELSTKASNGKYLYITLQIVNKRANQYIHRLVAGAFCNKPSRRHVEVNHIDGNKLNNHRSNLEWLTVEQNRQHAVDNDLLKHGEESHNVKLKLTQVHDILECLLADPFLNRSELCRKYGLGDHAVLRISKGQRWRRHVSAWCAIRGMSLDEFSKKVNPGHSALMSVRTTERNRKKYQP